MTRERKNSVEKLIASLQERAKELNCLYRIEDILRDEEQPLENIFKAVIEAIPPGWQYPDVCKAKIVFEGMTYHSPGFVETPWVQSADIVVQDNVVGTISIYYTEKMPPADEGPFLKEETKLVRTIAERLSHRIMHQRVRQIVRELQTTRKDRPEVDTGEWPVVLKMLKQTDRNLYRRISRKMLNHLCWSGIPEAEKLLQTLGTSQGLPEENGVGDWNRPQRRRGVELPADIGFAVFEIASDHLSDAEIVELIHQWIHEDRLGFLVQIVNRNVPLTELADAIRRYHHISIEEPDIRTPGQTGIHVSLVRRFLSDQMWYVGVARDYVQVEDFYNLLQTMIFSTESQGKLGGKSAGLYLAARVLEQKAKENTDLAGIKVPRTWYITSDVLHYFMHHNNFDDVIDQRYKGLDQIRLEYPHIEQTFKSARFPADIIKGLSLALDDFGDHPIIVRSSSLLEDRAGSAFSGKYKSLFLANQGSKQSRLAALTDAIAEVYASTYGPEAIEYRIERGLLDFGEEMGIMIQAVVGNRVGKYFLPSYAGVAFSNNEFRWSARIKREDGLLRLVPGLGTRAVDRLSDDYPILVAPGQPGLRVNTTPDEVLRYSPRNIDVINLETNTFDTLPFDRFLREAGYELEGVTDIVSILRDGRLQKPMGLNIDFDEDTLVANFEGLVAGGRFIKQVRAIINTLEETLGFAVDIEFASDGRSFYLLQCRPQSHTEGNVPAPIPRDLPKAKVIFSANRFVSDGRAPDITHIVYVDPRKYEQISDRSTMLRIGQAVGKLNRLLPKRQFVLMGPGRWGSRGDIKLGINVAYSDINNTAVLIEMALQKGSYLPELSFGTHFFQDLVEANIKYLPLYPDDDGVFFHERFLTRSPNILAETLPDFADLEHIVHLIDVPAATDGQVLCVLMNADLDEAIGVLTHPGEDNEPSEVRDAVRRAEDNYWYWRLQAARTIASHVDPERFGVVGFYVFGSTKNATAGPNSDIDLLIHFRGSPSQREELTLWLEGWSLSLAELNYLRTGYRADGLLDVHIVTDEDIENQNSYAVKIGAVTDAARELPMGGETTDSE